jgi:hypothetical protein
MDKLPFLSLSFGGVIGMWLVIWMSGGTDVTLKASSIMPPLTIISIGLILLFIKLINDRKYI